jgi:membrane protease YdiL (CAAX protease family)
MSKGSSKPAAKPVRQPLFNWGVADGLVLWLVAFRAPQYFVSELAVYTTTILPANGDLRNEILYLLVELLTIGVLAVFMRMAAMQLRDLGLTKIKWNWMLDVVVGYFAYILLTWVAALLGKLAHWDLDQPQELGFSTNPEPYNLVLMFVLLVIVVPITEELLFRGFLYRVFRIRTSFWNTALLVSLLFGLVHGNLGVGLDVFALSLVLCYLRESTQSLWPGIILHGLKNAIAFTVVYIVKLH